MPHFQTSTLRAARRAHATDAAADANYPTEDPVKRALRADATRLRAVLHALPFTTAEWSAIVAGCGDFFRYSTDGMPVCDLVSYVIDAVGYDGLAADWGIADPERFLDALGGLSREQSRAIEIAVERMDFGERCRVDHDAMRRVGIPLA